MVEDVFIYSTKVEVGVQKTKYKKFVCLKSNSITIKYLK